MPYRILLKQVRRVLKGKRKAKAKPVTFSHGADGAEVRNVKGLLLFYRPHNLNLLRKRPLLG